MSPQRICTDTSREVSVEFLHGDTKTHTHTHTQKERERNKYDGRLYKSSFSAKKQKGKRRYQGIPDRRIKR